MDIPSAKAYHSPLYVMAIGEGITPGSWPVLIILECGINVVSQKELVKQMLEIFHMVGGISFLSSLFFRKKQKIFNALLLLLKAFAKVACLFLNLMIV